MTFGFRIRLHTAGDDDDGSLRPPVAWRYTVVEITSPPVKFSLSASERKMAQVATSYLVNAGLRNASCDRCLKLIVMRRRVELFVQSSPELG